MRLMKILFLFFLALFMIGGTAIVGTQLAGVLSLNGDLVSGAKQVLYPWTFSFATACALCAFVLQYSKEYKEDEQD